MRAVVVALALVGLGVGAPVWGQGKDIDSEAYWQEGRQRLAALGSGYVVWESNRTGRWRIWRIELDGTGLRQLSPDEPDRDHLCPHISPDGTRLVYLSYPAGANTYGELPKDGQKVPMHLMSADGRFDRVVAEDARGYGEDRAAVWLNPDELIYIDSSRVTRRLNLKTGESQPLIREPVDTDDFAFGWLINATLTHASTGLPSFSPYNAQSRRVSPRAKQGGCQPYFTHDGVWGFWMGGGGGPINRFNLATGQVSPILEAKDPRLPKERSYLYFPMVSRCGRLFAFGASPDQHDHHTADYDIFVAQTDPATLEVIGKPVRYTFDKATDRFPDVYLADLDLGEHFGEAPYTVKLTAKPASGAWTWSFGDGAAPRNSPTGPSATHTYAAPGEYRVEARQGGRVLRGRVRVAKAQAPRPVSVTLRGDQEIVVAFDEPVRLAKPSVALASKAKVERWQLGEDGRSLRVTLAQKLKAADKLLLDGVTDRAQKPNWMRPAALEVRPVTWPVAPESLVFLWEDGSKPNLVRDASGKSERACRVRPRGRAWLTHAYAMRLSGGAFLAEDADAHLLAALKAANQMSLVAMVRPGTVKQSGPARIISFSTDPSSRNFTLGQEGDKLILRLRTPQTGENGYNPEVVLCTLSTSEANHIVVTYSPGQLVCYRNGQEVLKSDAVRGDFSNWAPHHLIFGDEWSGERRWLGALEGIALYNRALTPQEARASYEQYRKLLMARKPVPRIEVQARLVARSKVPTLKEIQPYRDALVTCEYEVEKVLRGKYDGKRIRVARWALLDGEALPAGQVKEGTQARLLLEPFNANPQLQSIYLSDTLEEDWELTPFFDVGGL